ncbi:anaphase-promoting complex subunit 3 [Lutibacter sp. Hel_I_33_5]|uniref:tetratricopeptide repeat protein n=1 Tax=Lutibacter sp. Hel_I_33_5 TaxID=1566289 RepID=UPI0011A2376B|nr:tetratricopeptide repeat protein [Lutibacter sp. Hel_I_33_5]TVZ56288.1 anaphase-promoting complex subunit 3 [Lutibacter sp. Hel_I_33_5]
MEEFENDVKKAIRNHERAALKSELQDLEATISKKSTLKKGTPKWLVAASVALLISLSGYYLIAGNSLNNQELYAEYYQPYRNVIHPVVRGDSSTDLKTTAFVYYENNNYKKAYDTLLKLYKKDVNPDYLLYQGICLLELNQPKKAITIFSKSLENNTTYSTKVTWYLALSYLQQNDIEKATFYLNKYLKSGDLFKKDEAETLLKKLK